MTVSLDCLWGANYCWSWDFVPGNGNERCLFYIFQCKCSIHNALSVLLHYTDNKEEGRWGVGGGADSSLDDWRVTAMLADFPTVEITVCFEISQSYSVVTLLTCTHCITHFLLDMQEMCFTSFEVGLEMLWLGAGELWRPVSRDFFHLTNTIVLNKLLKWTKTAEKTLDI